MLCEMEIATGGRITLPLKYETKIYHVILDLMHQTRSCLLGDLKFYFLLRLLRTDSVVVSTLLVCACSVKFVFMDDGQGLTIACMTALSYLLAFQLRQLLPKITHLCV